MKIVRRLEDYTVAVSCDRGSGRRPKTKKTAQRCCTILHGRSKTSKSHISHPIYSDTIHAISFTFCIAIDLGVTNPMPFTASKNSVWFKSYDFRKIDVFDLFFDSASNANCNENCNENCHAVGTRFHYFPVIVGQPNLVSSFLTSFPRGVWRNIPEKSNPPLRRSC